MELIITIIICVMVTCTTLFSHCSAQISQEELGIKELNNEKNVLHSNHVVKSGRIDPSRVVQLSWQPRVFAYRGLISDEECDHLISLARKNKENTTQRPSTGALVTLNVKDDIVARVDEKLSAWTLLPPGNSQPLQIRHYQNEAKQKYDYFENKSAWEVSEPLMATVVLYLSNVSRGGQISFPESQTLQLKASGLKRRMWEQDLEHYRLLAPIKGNAILFFNSHLNASPDESSRHERHPVVEGEMWCATKFIHMRPISVRKVRPESQNNDCTDEDDNCPQWASRGECQKNPIFMVGSPDYYGACRKSCNIC